MQLYEVLLGRPPSHLMDRVDDMFENRVKTLRIAKGLSLQQLAEAAEIEFAELLRVEAGVQHTRLDVLEKLCTAMEVELVDIFPSVAPQIQKIKQARSQDEAARVLDKVREQLEAAGIDLESFCWRLHVHLRGSTEHVLPISGPDCQRIRRTLGDYETKQFVVFISGPFECAINTRHLIACQFLVDPPSYRMEAQEKPDEFKLRFYLADRADPLEFDIYPDCADLTDEDASDESIQIQNLFYRADAEFRDRLTFADDNGEEVIINSDDVAMFLAPISLLYPAVWDAEHDLEEQEPD